MNRKQKKQRLLTIKRAQRIAYRWRRSTCRIERANIDKPGFVGVVTRFEVDGKQFDLGAVFLSTL